MYICIEVDVHSGSVHRGDIEVAVHRGDWG